MVPNQPKYLLLTKKCRSFIDTLCIDANDLDFQNHLYQKYEIIPESFEKVTIEFILQKSKHIRYLIKELDILLKKNGFIDILIVDSNAHSTFFRSRAQIKYEFSLATNGRYRLISKNSDKGILKLTYTKLGSTLPKTDTINRWSFGIVTNGTKNEWVKELVNSIKAQNIPEYEIIICGPSPFTETNGRQIENIKILDDITLIDDIRPPICHKKNNIIRNSAFNNLCILHDRYLLPDNWFENIKKYGNYFDALCLKTISPDGERFGVDWMKFTYPVTKRFALNRTLLFNEWHVDAIIPGGSIVVKKNLIKPFLLDERLFWDEMEDMQFSKRAYLNGLLINVDPNNYFISRPVNHKTQTIDWFHLKIFWKYVFIKSLIKQFVIYNKSTNYYKNNK